MPLLNTLSPRPPEPLAYHRDVVAHLQDSERELWEWATSAGTRAEEAEDLRTAMLKSNYRIDNAAHPELERVNGFEPGPG